MAWLISNFPGLLSIVSGVLAVVVLVLHMAHKEDVAAKVQEIEAELEKLAGKPKSS